ncbi:2006_t:CDS:2 [Acaulospora morrowiae]|uniref:Endoplasmic reticulum junction formation protein lunapark n=1 Tax=Acaulospora morrowiae TaxID=94023 RepID=A0A9N8ZBD8_9GLOM|nr:2006_t:CDS:2 [Acaulospora morrowiae]
MGALFSRFRSKTEDNYEKILSELDENIRRAEIRLREIRIRERNALIILIVYSLIAYVTYVAGYWYFVYMSTEEEEGWDLLKLAPVFTGPFLIVIGYKFETLWYRRIESNEQAQLEQLRAKQKLKIEELKKKTAYYVTKNLVERYDSPKEANQSVPHPPQGQKGVVLRPGQQINPNLRQRLPPNSQTPQTPQTSQTSSDHKDINEEKTNVISAGVGGNDSFPSNYSTNSPSSITPVQRRWYDKLVDILVGEDEQKYALICQKCFTWNGLTFPADFEDVQYICKNCNHFNPSRRSQRNGISSLDGPQNISSISNGTNGINDTNVSNFSMSNGRVDQISDHSKLVDLTTPRRGLAVSKRLASRSNSRRRRSSRSQNRLGNRQGSDDDNKPYVIDDDGINGINVREE